MTDEIEAIHEYERQHATCDIQQHPWQAVFGAGYEAGHARQRAEIERLGTALLSFIHAYANTERLDHDMVEVRLFEAWLKGCAALGIKAEPPTRRLEGSPT